MVKINNVAYLPLILGNKELLFLDFVTQLVLYCLICVLIQDEVPQYFLILIIFLFVELKQILFAVQVLFQLLDFFLKGLFDIQDLHSLVGGNLLRY